MGKATADYQEKGSFSTAQPKPDFCEGSALLKVLLGTLQLSC